MASPTPGGSSPNKTVIAPAAFYGVPKTSPKQLLGKDNLLDNIDCNESNLSGESSSEECDPITEDSSNEDVESTDANVETGVPEGDLKITYANKRYTWKKFSFDQVGTVFENDFPLPPAEPREVKKLFDLFVSRSMLESVVQETNK
ncbi:unnamed protein product [Ixodes pacificus]